MLDAIKQFLARATADVVKDVPGKRSAAQPYKEFMIQPAARKQGSQWLTAGVIFMDGPDGRREAEFIRSDMFASRDDAEACAFTKACQIIDEQGERLFEQQSP
ncbi:MAG: hypothetical protein HKN60_09875 [Rhizobiales bacterium]|nr:hypothetical protein [Hyphomicrobiales bacterium]